MTKQKVEIQPPDDWDVENLDALCTLRKWLNTFQTTSFSLSREEVQSFVDQAAEKFGIRAPEESFFLFDGWGDRWTWNPVSQEWEHLDLGYGGFDDGVERILNTYGIKGE